MCQHSRHNCLYLPQIYRFLFFGIPVTRVFWGGFDTVGANPSERHLDAVQSVSDHPARSAASPAAGC
jgi:hypothetical protein